MTGIGSLVFASPLVLLALVSLPVIWWLLRARPPAPQQVRFPAIHLLRDLLRQEETPVHTPLWLLLMRMALVSLFIIALADPVWQPRARSMDGYPLLVIMDDGWSTAPRWNAHTEVAERKLEEARRAGIPVALTGTTGKPGADAVRFQTADTARAALLAMQPQPLTPDRQSLPEKLYRLSPPRPDMDIVWISNGLDHGHAASFAQALNDLAGAGSVTLIEPSLEKTLMLLPPDTGDASLEVSLRRADTRFALTGYVQAKAADSRVVGSAKWQFQAGDEKAGATFDLPLALRNTIHHFQIDNIPSAGAIALLDARWKRRTVGIVSGLTLESDQPLLSGLYYLERALKPYAEIRRPRSGGTVSLIKQLTSQPLSVLVLADVGQLAKKDQELLEEWVRQGGFLIRFAGPRLASRADSLIPVRLRGGSRALDGTLSWTRPQGLGPFDAESPFAGLPVPRDVTVSHQVLADPAGMGDAEVWARLSDETPLVTATIKGRGRIVLFHSTANTDWTNLPLSGLYVDMLRRLMDLSQGVPPVAAGTKSLAPRRVLNGKGQFISPPPWIRALEGANPEALKVNPTLWPGFYGEEGAARALNLGNPDTPVLPLGTLSGVDIRTSFRVTGNRTLKPLFLMGAFLLLLLDALVALAFSGHLNVPRRVRFFLVLAPVLLPAMPVSTQAAESDIAFALRATSETRLAYVITGDPDIDETSRAGLAGLTRVLARRTSVKPGAPVGVHPDRDELAFFPLLYWPITGEERELQDRTIWKVDTFMKRGGTIFFDTQDHERAFSGITPQNTLALRRLLGNLDIPPLEPVPADHVLTKSFYLLQSFPGRWDGGEVWVESSSPDTRDKNGRNNDGVSAVIIGANDFAGAWALATDGRPLLPVAPGGERQREFAYRFGVNLVMYALTGNYKADQVHVPALLERLGQ